MLVVTVAEPRHLPLVRELLLAHTYWRLRGFQADLIILNQESPSYERPLHHQLQRQMEAHASEGGMDRPGGVFLRDWHAIPDEHRNLLLGSANVVLSGARGSLQQQLVAAIENPAPPAFVAAGGGPETVSPPLPFLELPYFNGLGGFTPDGTRIRDLSQARHNDSRAVGERHGKSGFRRDGDRERAGIHLVRQQPVEPADSLAQRSRQRSAIRSRSISATMRAARSGPRHRCPFGNRCLSRPPRPGIHGLRAQQPRDRSGTDGVRSVAKTAGDAVKICRLRLRNDSGRQRRLTVTYFAEWVLGSNREDQQLHVQHVSR